MKTDKQITLASLKKIYEKLPVLAETIPSIITDFDMNTFGIYTYNTPKQIKQHDCKTHGCGLGNSARLFRLVKSDFDWENEFCYHKFGARILPTTYDGSRLTSLWHFLFSSDWKVYQTSFEQFIERVKYAIDMDLEVGEWEFQKESFIKQ
jgi:hypothetical protein